MRSLLIRFPEVSSHHNREAFLIRMKFSPCLKRMKWGGVSRFSSGSVTSTSFSFKSNLSLTRYPRLARKDSSWQFSSSSCASRSRALASCWSSSDSSSDSGSTLIIFLHAGRVWSCVVGNVLRSDHFQPKDETQ